MQLVPSELNAMPHTGGDAVTRAGVEKLVEDAGFFDSMGLAAIAGGTALFEILAPNTSKAEGTGDILLSLTVDTLNMLDPGVQEIYIGIIWATNKATDLEIEVQTLEDFHEIFLAEDSKKEVPSESEPGDP